MAVTIPVIDLFAGPGGLGEGFSALIDPAGRQPFKIALSIEKDPTAHRTLLLRSFYRQFPPGAAPEAYYQRLRGQITTADLFNEYPNQATAAREEAWNATLGDTADSNYAPLDDVRRRIRHALSRYPGGEDHWVLIGGPPCQAYSLVGRSRNKGKAGYRFEDDPRARLYREYLQLIGDFWPSVFVMENVRGLLSAKLDGQPVIDLILNDLQDPVSALHTEGRHSLSRGRRHRYTLLPLTCDAPFTSGGDFLIQSEMHGIPQARHRVIIVGIRDDVNRELRLLDVAEPPFVCDILGDLPRIRSGLSKEPDSPEAWRRVVEAAASNGLSEELERLFKSLAADGAFPEFRGSEFVRGQSSLEYRRDWYLDPRLGGFCNHAARSHIREDVHRYLFAALYAHAHDRSPNLADFPPDRLPQHKNAQGSHFADRFRVQVRHRPSTTVTSHISKDGHYYIHYDPLQCRSLTVREAARLQTFPDNYFFEGPRTAQYVQVGNAVPPLLAVQIAERIAGLFADG